MKVLKPVYDTSIELEIEAMPPSRRVLIVALLSRLMAYRFRRIRPYRSSVYQLQSGTAS